LKYNDKNRIEENFNVNKNKPKNRCLNHFVKLNIEKTILKNHNIPKLSFKSVKFNKQNTATQKNSHRDSKIGNSFCSNYNLTESNKSHYKAKSKIFTTNKKESRYIKIFKTSGRLTNKKTNILNTEKRFKHISLRSSFNKNEKKRNFKNTIKKLRLFHDNGINDSNTMDIKSYETALDFPSILETQEKKLSLLSSSLLILTQKDELLYNNNFEEKLESSVEFILVYLSLKDLFNLALINKEFFKIIIRYLLENAEIKVQIIKDKIKEIINKSKGFINIKEKDFKKFEKNIFNERAMNLIDSISKKRLFKEKSSLMNNKDIILLFELFFISIGKKIDIIQFDTNDSNTKNKRWNYFCNYY
jgi:hypothetical protein